MPKLGELMKEKGFKTKNLQRLLGTSYMVAWNKMNGRTETSPLEKKVIAEWLGVNESELKGE